MKLKLTEKRDEARGTKSFFWQPESQVAFQPGQYFYYTLPKLNYPDERGATRHFTVASSPTEGNFLRLTTRIRPESGYKKTLDELPIGAVIDAEGPTGTFTFSEKESGPQVFIAGGIGITPFRCFIKYAVDKKLTTLLYLIYSNSDSDFVYKSELESWKSDHLKIDFIDSAKEGHLDAIKIKQQLESWELEAGGVTFWVVGPPPFTSAIEEVLGKMQVASANLRTEKFTGY